jgi:hypothetical protein
MTYEKRNTRARQSIDATVELTILLHGPAAILGPSPAGPPVCPPWCPYCGSTATVAPVQRPADDLEAAA